MARRELPDMVAGGWLRSCGSASQMRGEIARKKTLGRTSQLAVAMDVKAAKERRLSSRRARAGGKPPLRADRLPAARFVKVNASGAFEGA